MSLGGICHRLFGHTFKQASAVLKSKLHDNFTADLDYRYCCNQTVQEHFSLLLSPVAVFAILQTSEPDLF
ncbi:unnamed protein product [Arctogadus glacialis]